MQTNLLPLNFLFIMAQQKLNPLQDNFASICIGVDTAGKLFLLFATCCIYRADAFRLRFVCRFLASGVFIDMR